MPTSQSNQSKPDLKRTDLKRTLGLFSATALVIGSMVGSGIFLVTPDAARFMGSADWLIALWVLTGIITILGATSYGKLAAYMPEAGGQYVFLKECWGKLPAFLYGWVFFWVIQTGFLAAVAIAFSRYVGVLWPIINTQPLFMMPFDVPFTTEKALALVCLTGLTYINTRGVKAGATIQNIFTSMKVIALFILIGVGVTLGQHIAQPGVLDWTFAIEPNSPLAKTGLLATISVAAIGPLFSSDAWNYVTFIGGEVIEPKKTLPRALILGATLVVILYVLANIAYVNVVPFDLIQTVPDDKVAALMMRTLFGDTGQVLIAIIILVSTFGCLNGMIFSGARVFYAMAHDGLFLHQFGQLDAKTQSPNFSLWAQYGWALLLALSGSYSMLLAYIIFTALIFYIITMAGLLKLAQRIPEQVNMTKAIDYVPPVLYIIAATVLCAFMLTGESSQGTSLMGIALVLTGLPVYWFGFRPKPRLSQ